MIISLKDNKRIALFIPSLIVGGVERVMLNLARGFVEREIKVDLVVANAEGPFLSHVPNEVRVINLEARRVLKSLPGLVRYLRQEQPISLLSSLDHANVVALLAKKIAKVPTRVVVSVHTHSGMSKNLKEKLMPYWIRPFYPSATAIVAVSQGLAEDRIRLARLPTEKVKVIYNPVVTPELYTRAEEPINHPWFTPGEPPVILGVGSLKSVKDFPLLIRAFALVRKHRPARLMILGEGEERKKLESLIYELDLQKDVSLPGYIENPYKYMKYSRVFVLSSKWEGLPTVLIEAMALGTPVISTDCPSGPNEILENGKWGTLVPVGDVDALAKAIMKAIDEERGRGIERAKVFELNNIVDRYAEILFT